MKGEVYQKLRQNSFLGKKPTTISELATLLNTSRTAIYDAFHGEAVNVQKKINNWLNSNGKNDTNNFERGFLLVRENKLDELEKYGFKYSFGFWERNIVVGDTCKFQLIVDEEKLILNMYVENDYKIANLDYDDFIVMPDDEFETPRVDYSNLIVDEFLPIDGVIYNLILDGIVYKN